MTQYLFLLYESISAKNKIFFLVSLKQFYNLLLQRHKTLPFCVKSFIPLKINGTARFKKRKQFFEYQHLLFHRGIWCLI